MADRSRTLNIPMYDVKDADSDVLIDDDDVIDVETIDLDATIGERLRGFARDGAEAVADAVRNVKLNGARDAFFTQPADHAREAAGGGSSRTRARQEGREQRREEARLRAERAADGRREQSDRAKLERDAKNDPLAKLKVDTIRAGEAYMESLRASGVFGPEQTKATQRKQLSGLHQVYASMMVMQCVRPLQQGLSGQNVVSTLGMAASMWMLSPDFRTQVGNFAGQIGGVIRAKINGREEAKDAKAKGRFEKLAALGKGDQLAGKWRKRLDRIEHAERGYRLPFSAQSAAMTEVALAEAAYADMRRPGADASVIQARYETALSALYEYIDDDGIDREDVSRSMRVIVGQRLDKDPSIANVFGELGHGRFSKSEPREVFINGTTEKITVWTGDFVDSYEGRTISAGSFKLRPVMNLDEHRVMSAETLAADLCSASSATEMNDALSQFVVAAAVSEYPDVVDDVDDPAARRRFGKVRTMFSSMANDGLTESEARFAYSAAFVDAVEIAQAVRPELGAEWTAKYGENWRERVADEIRRYKDMGAQAERERGASSQSPFFRAERDGEPASHDAGHSTQEEDIVDADVVSDRSTSGGAPFPQTSRTATAPSHAARRRNRSATAIDEPVYEGELIEDEDIAGEEIIEVDAEDLGQLGAGRARAAILSGATSSLPAEETDSKPGRGSVSKIRAARVNQHYNEVETGGITGIGSDDATPLQDVDFQLG